MQDALGELDGVLGRDADVLGDAAVGIVDVLGQHAELVLPPRIQPAQDGDVRQPGPPIDLQAALDVQLDGDGDAGRADDAQQTFNRVVAEFPDSAFSADAKRELDALKKAKTA